jgi:hypothetical protein
MIVLLFCAGPARLDETGDRYGYFNKTVRKKTIPEYRAAGQPVFGKIILKKI